MSVLEYLIWKSCHECRFILEKLTAKSILFTYFLIAFLCLFVRLFVCKRCWKEFRVVVHFQVWSLEQSVDHSHREVTP